MNFQPLEEKFQAILDAQEKARKLDESLQNAVKELPLFKEVQEAVNELEKCRADYNKALKDTFGITNGEKMDVLELAKAVKKIAQND